MKGYKAKSAKGESDSGEVRGSPVQTSKSSLTEGLHRTLFIPPAMIYDNMFEMLSTREAH